MSFNSGYDTNCMGRWRIVGAAAVTFAIALTVGSLGFTSVAARRSLPILAFAWTLATCGILFLWIIPLIGRTAACDRRVQRDALLVVVVAGLLARYVLLASTPILELDFNRYLWDGGLAANGFNPYAVAPADVSALPYNDIRLELSRDAGSVFERITYPELRTVYPPVAQAAFAIAHWLEPWGLTGWRLVAFSLEGVTLALVIALLKAVGRSPLWCALYWLSPLVMKETINSAHMDVVVTPLVLGALLLAARDRHLASVGLLGLAIGAKLWPVMLVPLLLRPLLGTPARLAGAITLLSGIATLLALPVWLGGLDRQSGFIGFARDWSTNSAHFPVVEGALRRLVGAVGFADPAIAGMLARVLLGFVLVGYSLRTAWRPIAGPGDLIARAASVAGAVVLLSPAQFPWYVLWVLPLAVLRPGIGWHVAAAVLPLYYAAFHYIVRDRYPADAGWIVWAIWMPVWLALAWDRWSSLRPGTGDRPAG